MTRVGVCWRRFMLGHRSVPPATSEAWAPCSARSAAASATVRGAKYWNRGKGIMIALLAALASGLLASFARRRQRLDGRRHRGAAHAIALARLFVHRRAVAAFPRRRHDQRLGPFDRGKARRSEALRRRAERLEDLLRRDRHFV